MQMSSSFEVLQFCQAMKASKKRSQPKDKTHEGDKKDKTHDGDKKDKTHDGDKKDKKDKTHKKRKITPVDDDIERVFMDNFSSSGFFNYSF